MPRHNYKLTDLGPVFQMDALNHQAEADYHLADQVVWVLIGLFVACLLLLAFWPELEGMLPWFGRSVSVQTSTSSGLLR